MNRTGLVLWIVVFLGMFTWSAIYPHDRFTWFLEVFPAMIGFVVVIMTWTRFPLTPLVSILILVHAGILMVGGHYTYSEVPLFNDIRDLLDGSRNNFDKVGHFTQGFIPAMIAREILIRREVIVSAGWRSFFIVCFCLAFSALYELIEWWVAVLTGDSAEAFLGTQGYVWDTQSDMMLALIGAVTALVVLSRYHDRELKRLHGCPDGE